MTNFHLDTALKTAAEFIARVPEPKFRPLKDLVVVKPLDQKYGIVLMASTVEGLTVQEPGDGNDAFLAVVVTTGIGDRLIHYRCLQCGAPEKRSYESLGEIRAGHGRYRRGLRECGSCGADSWEKTGESRIPMELKRGDVIACPRRPHGPAGEMQMALEGEEYIAFFEEQFAFAQIEVELAA